MAISLEELKRQRKQIRVHLEWLDAKIAEFSASEAEQPIAKEEPAAMAPLPDHAQLHVPPEASRSIATTQASMPRVPNDESDPDDTPQYKTNTSKDLLRAKVGCLLLFITGTVLFLFLLFGLPYLL